MEAILFLMKVIMETLNLVIQPSVLSEIISEYRVTMYKARKILGVQRDGFAKLFIWPNCQKPYSFESSQKCIGRTFSDIFVA